MKKHLKQIPRIMGSMAMGGMVGGIGTLAAEKVYPGMGSGVSSAASMMPAMGSIAMMGPMVGMMGSTMKSMPRMKKKKQW